MNIVITAGGTRERIDDVRSIINSSSGKLGYKIATEFTKVLHSSTIFYIHGNNATPFVSDNSLIEVKNIAIRDTSELMTTVKRILEENQIDIFIHSMAVADYTPDKVFDWETFKNLIKYEDNLTNEVIEDYMSKCSYDTSGKMPSGLMSPMISLKATPKVIEEIKKTSPHTFLVGFKLLENVNEETLFDVGFNLLRKNRCNLVLANDLASIRSGNHRGMLIYPEKTSEIVEGKENIASLIVQKSIERQAVKHPKSIKNSQENNIRDMSLIEKFVIMGKFLDERGFLPRVLNHDRKDKIGTYGNMSCKNGGFFYITGRNVDKGNLNGTDIVSIDKVWILEDDKDVYSNVFYSGALKPSIDTTIHSEIYKQSSFSHIIHIHTDRVFLGYPLVAESFPCGCDKECNAIVKLIKANPDTRIVQMKKHGLIILGNSFEECKTSLEELFSEVPYIDYSTNEISNECIEHLREVGVEYNQNEFYPLKINSEDIGCLYEVLGRENVNFGIFTMKNVRGKGFHIVENYLKLYDRFYYLYTTEKCGVVDFYKNKCGFRHLTTLDGKIILVKEK